MLHLLYINEYIQSICLYRPHSAKLPVLPAYRMSIQLPIQLYIFVLFIYLYGYFLSVLFIFLFFFSHFQLIKFIDNLFVYLFHLIVLTSQCLYRQHYLWLMIAPRKEKLLTFFHPSTECISFDTTQIL